MKLKMGTCQARKAVFGDKTAFRNGTLVINRDELQTLLTAEENRFSEVTVDLAVPGEAKRIVHILDAIEPRVKVEGGDCVFPGFTGSIERVGSGSTHRLAGMAVLTCAEFKEFGPDSMMGANESMVDMAGPGAQMTPFGNTINLVLNFKRGKDVSTAAFSEAIRNAGFKAATYLGETIVNQKPETEKVYSLETPSGNLTNVAAVILLSSLSLPLRESFVYGHPAGNMLPTVLHPNEVLDGALVGNYFIYGGVRNPTYFYQNNPVVEELYQRHNVDWNFKGAIVSRAGSADRSGKIAQAAAAAQIAQLLDVKGAIVTANAGGQQVMDLMFMCERLERQHIKSVGILHEMADENGSDSGMVGFVSEANALVSVGNREEIVHLPAMETVIGGDTLQDGFKAAGKLDVPLRHLMCSGTQVGAWNIGGKPY